MTRRRAPRGFPQRVTSAIESMIPGTVGGRVANASPAPGGGSDSDAARLGAVGTTGNGTETEFYRDRFALAADGGQDLTLTYTPVEFSEHVYLNGVELDEDTDWSRDDVTLSLLAPAGVLTGDVVDVRYAYLSGAPVTPDELPPLISTIGFELFTELGINTITYRDADGTTFFADDFNRANGAPGNGWTVPAGVAISSDVLTSSVNFAQVTRDLSGVATFDAEIELVLTTTDLGHGFQVAASDMASGSYYFFKVDLVAAGTIRVKFIQGAFDAGVTTIGDTGSISGVREGTWRFKFDGTTYSAALGGVTELTGTV